MPLAEDLLEQAERLARLERRKPKQASLRRAISTAYYALFHLLVAEAAANWKHRPHRAALGRSLDHGKMKTASLKAARSSNAGLRTVAKSFVELQERRHLADYDSALRLSRSDALRAVRVAEGAFQNWEAVRSQGIAKDYLLAFLIRER